MLKRIFDIVVSFLALILLLPILLVVTFISRFIYRQPAFFFQPRPGLKAKPFVIIKFCTMTNDKDSLGNLLPDEDRLTSYGKFLRQLSIDELPQLINVLIGDLSLVGPRPLLTEYLTLYNSRQIHRHDVKQGITGWAQVNGRNTLSWPDKLEMDVWYVENQSFWLDMKILYLTVIKVFRREDISSVDCSTMQKFQGNEDE